MKILVMVLGLIGPLINAIKEIEKAFPQSGLGTVKLELLKETLEKAYPEIIKVWSLIESLVQIYVAAFNKNGWFGEEKKQ